MKILEALARLRLQPLEQGRNLLSKQTPESIFKTFVDTPRILRDRLRRPISTKSLLDVTEVHRRWEARDFSLSDLNLAEIKCLCAHAETAVLPQLVRSLGSDSRLPQKPTWLMGLAAAYCTKWSSIERRPDLEELLRRSFNTYTGTNEALTQLKIAAQGVFGPSADRFIADAAVASLTGVEVALKKYNLPTTGDLAMKGRTKLSDSWIQRFKSTPNEADAKSLLEYLLKDVFASPAPSPELYRAIDLIIQSRHAENSESFRQIIQKYALNTKSFGDPRLPGNRANWAPIPNAAQTLLSWLAREGLLFFFDLILPNSSENRQRKEFWLRYYKSIRDFQVAVSERDIQRLRARVRDLPGYSRIDHPTTSAFLMKFAGTPDIVIVEFSETGHAAYVHNAKTFEAAIGDFRQYRFLLRDKLKHESKIDRILHLPVNSWQWKAANMLAAWGIRP